MLVTFISEAHANVTMFGDIALQLLKLMGHSGVIPSALSAAEVPAALAHLEQAFTKKSTDTMANFEDNTVSLKHRALPLIQLLQAAVKQERPVIWKQGL